MQSNLYFDADRFETLHITRAGVTITVRAYENLLYCETPVDPEHQRLSVYVPCGADGGKRPIFMPNTIGGYMPGFQERPGTDLFGRTNAAFEALKRGYLVVSPAARGRGLKDAAGRNIGTAPAGLVDLKAAVRYLRHNTEHFPGDTEHIITNGTSAGGAMSALLGCTGNRPEYEPYLREIGAADERDDIYAASCYCPITNLDHADMAYEWEFAGRRAYSFMRPALREEHGEKPREHVPHELPPLEKVEGLMSDEQMAVSAELAAAFPAYVNSLALQDGTGKRLTLDADGRGSFAAYIHERVLESINRAVQRGEDLSALSWITFTDGCATDYDDAAYIDWRGRMKQTPAFDNIFGAPTAENIVFGNAKQDACHFTAYGSAHSRSAFPAADPAVVRLMNPMNFIGEEGTALAPHFRIRHGSRDRDTSLAISAMLTLKLQEAGAEVDYHLPWGLPHAGDYDLEELFSWIERIV